MISSRKGAYDLYLKSASGTGTEELLVESAEVKVATDWSDDGRFLLFYRVDPQTDRDLWVLPMEGDRTPWVFLKTPFDERNASLGGTAPGGQWQVSTAGGIFPKWRRDGQELYYLNPEEK